MATLRQRNAAWQAIVRRGDKTFSRSFPSRIDAEAWAREKEAEVHTQPAAVPGDVIVVYRHRVIRVAPQAWNDVMDAAGQMANEWGERGQSLGHEQERIDAGLTALNRMFAVALKGE